VSIKVIFRFTKKHCLYCDWSSIAASSVAQFRAHDVLLNCHSRSDERFTSDVA